MGYWRMQLHPGVPSEAIRYTVMSLAAGVIGLDFGSAPGPTPAADDVGDLFQARTAALPRKQRHYRAFATEMAEGDHVLVFVHNFPFALCRVAGPYTYDPQISPESGRWFRHFRHVEDVRFYADRDKDPREWERITMNATIAPLRTPSSKSYRLIKQWLGVPPNNALQLAKPAQAMEPRRSTLCWTDLRGSEEERGRGALDQDRVVDETRRR